MSYTKVARRRDLVLEEVQWLAGYDHPDNLARRLGYKSGVSLVTQLQHWRRYDLAERVTRDYRADSRRAA